MLKVRVTFVDDKDGQEELKKIIKSVKNDHRILNQSSIYRGRNNSQYSNIYLDIEKKK
ncbi:hypothetical protein [Candidatus Clostridium helianthi]|uniref:DUF3970 domain-containing protein n=1 Tax=Candidatus Clostridium helianthi TaxID=3381660 RepID=A0ABW8SBJ7_9CLOT